MASEILRLTQEAFSISERVAERSTSLPRRLSMCSCRRNLSCETNIKHSASSSQISNCAHSSRICSPCAKRTILRKENPRKLSLRHLTVWSLPSLLQNTEKSVCTILINFP